MACSHRRVGLRTNAQRRPEKLGVVPQKSHWLLVLWTKSKVTGSPWKAPRGAGLSLCAKGFESLEINRKAASDGGLAEGHLRMKHSSQGPVQYHCKDY